MKLVYFNEPLVARGAGVISHFYWEEESKWIFLTDIILGFHRMENITLRPATETETRRAETIISLYEIGVMLGKKVGDVLDQPGPVTTGVLTALRDAVESVVLPTQTVDSGSCSPGTSTASPGSA
ncbi:MAG: hypothetical protein Q7T25_00345 [Sideroxyarcus sp.]|nr:hypothetical protein [Sideroxyarcus sp.]